MIRTFVLATAWLVPAVYAGSLPNITNFTALPSMITSGQMSTLTWRVTGATSLTIDVLGSVSGTLVKVRPWTTTTYTLTATNLTGSVTASTTITVGTIPVISWFIASPTQVRSGQSITLMWGVTGASALRIGPIIGSVTGTSVTVSPRATTVYTLTATNVFGSQTASVTVVMGSAPIIGKFTATPTKIAPGQTTTLSWTVGGAGTPSLSISGLGFVSGNSLKVSPSVSTNYVLTAINNYGSSAASVTVYVGTQPAITSFTATPTVIGQGQSSTLSWAVTGSPASSLFISGVGFVTGTSVTVGPSISTTYTLTASNAFGYATAPATVGAGNPPTINYFSTNPSLPAGPGVPATLSWSVTGATSVSIDNGVGTVTGNSVKVLPIAPTTYTLTATNPAGSTTTTATVKYIPLVKVTNQLYYSEHSLFIVPGSNQVAWTGGSSWAGLYSDANISTYVATLLSKTGSCSLK